MNRFLTAAVLFFATHASAATSFQVNLPEQATTGQAFTFTVTARNGTTADPSYVGIVHFTSSDPGATLPADYTFTPADAGTHTFTATFATSGQGASLKNQTITATDTTTASITGSDFSIVQWAPHLTRVFAVYVPDAVNRNESFQVVVQALNASHMPVTGYTGTIHLNASPAAGATIPPDYTFTPADNGAHSFPFTLALGGEGFVGVNDTSDSYVNGSDEFMVVCPATELSLSADNSGPVCPGHATGTAWVTSNQSGLTYLWQKRGSLWSRQSANPVVEGLLAGTYLVSTTDANGCRATAETVIPEFATVNPTASMPISSCGTGPVTATITNGAAFASIEWFVVNGSITSGQGTASVEVTPTAEAFTGGLWIRADTWSADGCRTELQSRRVDVYPGLDAEITTASNICSASSSTASVSASGPASYRWSIANGSITGGQGTRSIQYKPSGAGDVTLSVEVSNAHCTSTDSATVAVNGPTALVDSQQHICEGDSAVIPVVLSGTPPFRIIWSDGVVQSDIDATSVERVVTPTRTMAYAVTEVSDANCAGTASGFAEIVVDTDPELVTDPKNTSIARGQSATLSVEAAGTIVRYDWYRGRSGDRSHLVASGASPSYTTPTLFATTSYWVEAVNSCGAAQSKTATVAVKGKRRAVTPR